MNNETYNPQGNQHKTLFAVLGGALVAALGANGFLWVRSNHLNDEIAKTKDATSVQIAELSSANETARQQYQKRLEDLSASINTAQTAANAAAARARAEAAKAAEQFSQVNGRIDQNQTQLATEITGLKGADQETATKINDFSTAIKTDVEGVKTEVTDVKAQVADAKTMLEAHATDLKRMTGDMGVMSDRIATNGKDLEALRALGERNYYEFTLSKSTKTRKVGDIVLTYKKADPKRGRYTIEASADDKKIEKKDKTVNEPVQIFVGGNRQASEVVVNQINKDEIVGYVSVPKVMVSRR